MGPKTGNKKTKNPHFQLVTQKPMLVLKVFLLLLMEDILHQLVGSLSYYLQYFIHPRWLIRRISEPSTLRVPLLLGDQKSPPKTSQSPLALRRVSFAWCSCPCWAPCCPICCWCPTSPGTKSVREKSGNPGIRTQNGRNIQGQDS